jgi:hypothetical protein
VFNAARQASLAPRAPPLCRLRDYAAGIKDERVEGHRIAGLIAYMLLKMRHSLEALD